MGLRYRALSVGIKNTGGWYTRGVSYLRKGKLIGWNYSEKEETEKAGESQNDHTHQLLQYLLFCRCFVAVESICI